MNVTATHLNAPQAARVRSLEQVFEHIQRTRMHAVPVLHPALRVQAVGFELVPDGDGQCLQGVLISPWFMNLVRMPVHAPAAGWAGTRVGQSQRRDCGALAFDFIGGYEDGVGPFEACSLFSPMFEFVDQAAAVATAQAVLTQVRAAVPVAAPVSAPTPLAVPQEPVPSRRGFLFGRGAQVRGA